MYLLAMYVTCTGTGAYGFTGDGSAATNAQLAYPTGVALDTLGNIYIAELLSYRIRKVTASTGIISTIAGTAQSNWMSSDTVINGRLRLVRTYLY